MQNNDTWKPEIAIIYMEITEKTMFIELNETVKGQVYFEDSTIGERQR